MGSGASRQHNHPPDSIVSDTSISENSSLAPSQQSIVASNLDHSRGPSLRDQRKRTPTIGCSPIHLGSPAPAREPLRESQGPLPSHLVKEGSHNSFSTSPKDVSTSKGLPPTTTPSSRWWRRAPHPTAAANARTSSSSDASSLSVAAPRRASLATVWDPQVSLVGRGFQRFQVNHDPDVRPGVPLRRVLTRASVSGPSVRLSNADYSEDEVFHACVTSKYTLAVKTRFSVRLYICRFLQSI
jgi:hypothetical protein